MRKKIVLLLGIFLIFGTYFFIQYKKDKPANNKDESHISEVYSENQARIELLNSLKKELDAKTDTDVFEKTHKLLVDQVYCIRENDCLDNEDVDDSVKKLDPAYTVVRKSLEILNAMTLTNEELVNEIDDEVLMNILSFQHPGSQFLTLNILMRKGVESFKQTLAMSENLKGMLAGMYLKFLSADMYMQEDSLLSARNELLEHYLDQDHDTVVAVFGSLASLKLNSSQAKKLAEKACFQIKDITDSEQKTAFKSAEAKINKKYNLSVSCF